ncbi:hypothetical protein Stube_10130 [Streptomyces tubercidicus]|uniref:DUF5753 domain-containing protein n=1 Tax=Streptomyces tubercidicus TaxID=47759 RepID=A0A640ULB7_9ACTN|nr:hypothetical protein Stube_10130 [Streptomyces tubercidicus]
MSTLSGAGVSTPAQGRGGRPALRARADGAIGERRPFNRLVNLLTLPDRPVVSYVESETHGHLDREITSVLPLVRACHQLQAEALSQRIQVAMTEQLRKGTL